MTERKARSLTVPGLKSWKGRVLDLLNFYEKSLSSRQPSKLEDILMPGACLAIMPDRIFICGRQEIIDFWGEQIKKGLTGLSFTVQNIFPAEREILNKECNGYHRYDRAFYVFGTYTVNLKSGKARVVKPANRFCLIMKHSENCPMYVSDHIFY